MEKLCCTVRVTLATFNAISLLLDGETSAEVSFVIYHQMRGNGDSSILVRPPLGGLNGFPPIGVAVRVLLWLILVIQFLELKTLLSAPSALALLGQCPFEIGCRGYQSERGVLT